jgi:hypothetical protein
MAEMGAEGEFGQGEDGGDEPCYLHFLRKKGEAACMHMEEYASQHGFEKWDKQAGKLLRTIPRSRY